MDALGISAGMVASLVIALSFAAGLNVYATVFSLGVMARLHWVVLPPGLESLANAWIIGASGVMFAGEFVADKIPGFDVMWNALHTFVRIPVAALLAYAAGEHLSPGMHVLVTCLGAGIAALAHSSKTAVRLGVTPSPEPVSNIALSTAEDGISVGLSWAAMHHPMAAGMVAVGLCIASVGAVLLSLRLLRGAVQRFRREFVDFFSGE
jgi:Domain of unknown function (DUF4126)